MPLGRTRILTHISHTPTLTLWTMTKHFGNLPLGALPLCLTCNEDIATLQLRCYIMFHCIGWQMYSYMLDSDQDLCILSYNWSLVSSFVCSSPFPLNLFCSHHRRCQRSFSLLWASWVWGCDVWLCVWVRGRLCGSACNMEPFLSLTVWVSSLIRPTLSPVCFLCELLRRRLLFDISPHSSWGRLPIQNVITTRIYASLSVL